MSSRSTELAPTDGAVAFQSALAAVLVASLVAVVVTTTNNTVDLESDARIGQTVRLAALLSLMLAPVGFTLVVSLWSATVVIFLRILGVRSDTWRVIESLAIAEAVYLVSSLLAAGLGHPLGNLGAGFMATETVSSPARSGILPLFALLGWGILLIVGFRHRVRLSPLHALVLGSSLLSLRGSFSVLWSALARA